MANKEKYTKEQISKALWDANGFISKTARNLGCTDKTIYNYFKKYPELQDNCEFIRNYNLDLAESELVKLIKKGNLGAICFYLKCQGKKRGYFERVQVAGDKDEPLEVNVNKKVIDKMEDGR